MEGGCDLQAEQTGLTNIPRVGVRKKGVQGDSKNRTKQDALTKFQCKHSKNVQERLSFNQTVGFNLTPAV